MASFQIEDTPESNQWKEVGVEVHGAHFKLLTLAQNFVALFMYLL